MEEGEEEEEEEEDAVDSSDPAAFTEVFLSLSFCTLAFFLTFFSPVFFLACFSPFFTCFSLFSVFLPGDACVFFLLAWCSWGDKVLFTPCPCSFTLDVWSEEEEVELGVEVVVEVVEVVVEDGRVLVAFVSFSFASFWFLSSLFGVGSWCFCSWSCGFCGGGLVSAAGEVLFFGEGVAWVLPLTSLVPFSFLFLPSFSSVFSSSFFSLSSFLCS